MLNARYWYQTDTIPIPILLKPHTDTDTRLRFIRILIPILVLVPVWYRYRYLIPVEHYCYRNNLACRSESSNLAWSFKQKIKQNYTNERTSSRTLVSTKTSSPTFTPTWTLNSTKLNLSLAQLSHSLFFLNKNFWNRNSSKERRPYKNEKIVDNVQIGGVKKQKCPNFNLGILRKKSLN